MGISRWAVRIDAAIVELELRSDGGLTANGVAIAATALGRGEWLVRVGNTSTRVFVAGTADAPWIWHEGVAYRPQVAQAGARPARRREASGDLSAPMPATVRAIHVSAGQAVSRGETLIVLEAMKMELPLKAPQDGVVTAIACRTGELVQPGVPLVKVE